MKKCLALLLALMLCLGTAALAEQVEGPIFESDSLYDIAIVKEGDAFIYTDRRTGKGVVTMDGQRLCDPVFGALSWEGYGYLEAINENGLDTHGLIDMQGNEMIPYKYSAFQVFSENWAGAVVLTPTEDEDADYSSGYFGTGDRYNIDHMDIYRLPEGTQVGTLDRQSFSKARSVGQGEYLLVKDRNDGLTLYNSQFEKVDHLFESFNDPEIVLRQENSMSKMEAFFAATGAKLEGFDAERLSRLDGKEDYIIVRKTVTVNMKKRDAYGLMNNAGEMISKIEMPDIVRLCDGRYVYVREYRDGVSCNGVYDLEAGKMIVPMEYDDIYYTDDQGCFNGYFLVKKGDKLGYVDTEGNVTCPIEYAKDSIYRKLGACFVVKEGEQLTLVAADGTVTDLSALGARDGFWHEYGADGRYFTAQNDEGKYCIMDWHGNFIVEFDLDSIPEFYRDGYVAYDGSIFHIA